MEWQVSSLCYLAHSKHIEVTKQPHCLQSNTPNLYFLKKVFFILLPFLYNLTSSNILLSSSKLNSDFSQLWHREHMYLWMSYLLSKRHIELCEEEFEEWLSLLSSFTENIKCLWFKAFSLYSSDLVSRSICWSISLIY